ncbi:MAG: hypothetical protein ACM3MB_07690 [Acidobacteriota bacterium]
MKKVMAVICTLFFLMASFGISAADNDKKGSKDHPLLSRMPNFYIESYEDKEFDSHKFIMQTGKPALRLKVISITSGISSTRVQPSPEN